MTLLPHIRVVKDGIHDKYLGRGARAGILEIEYLGLKCAGKKLHDWLLNVHGSYTERIIRRFEEECRLLSQVCHPNIVQFLGVYFQQGERAPILVMEFLPTNLTSCIEQHGILPKEISYSILHDVALGLHYLHSQTPPILHRSLSSKHILLTPNMTAKISNLGSARVLEHRQDDERDIRHPPGTDAFMPPEVMKHPPSMYDTFIDEFSYGVLMIHVFSGRWPAPTVLYFRNNPAGTLSEAERREVFLRSIGDDHPLMDLILKCIDNNPQARPHVTEIVERLSEMVVQFPAFLVDRLEMLAENKNIIPESDRD